MLRILLINIGVLNNVTMVIDCEFIPLNRCKASDAGARIKSVAIHSFWHWLEVRFCDTGR